MVHRLTKEEARRIAIRAQLLDAHRPTGVVAMVDHLTMLQLDPTATVAPSADLVAWSRIGSTYQPADLQRALEQDRTLFEYDAVIQPIRDLGLYLAGAPDRPQHERPRRFLEANAAFRRDILDRLKRSGPMTSRQIPVTSVVSWPSSG